MRLAVEIPSRSCTRPLGQRIEIETLEANLPRPKWASIMLWPMELPPADISRICLSPSAVTVILAPIPSRLLVVPSRSTISQWLPLSQTFSSNVDVWP